MLFRDYSVKLAKLVIYEMKCLRKVVFSWPRIENRSLLKDSI
jgi:hypothetical protein